MKVLTDIFKIVGACSVLSVFGCVIYLLAFETWKAIEDARAYKRGIRRLQQIAEESMTQLRVERELEALYRLPAREPRRRA